MIPIHPSFLRRNLFGLLGLLLLGTGCRGPKVVPLMPTPVLYSELRISPLDHIPEEEQWMPRKVYYATNRSRSSNLQIINYDNDPSERISVGLALIGFGNEQFSWTDLQAVSKATSRDEEVDLSIAGLIQAGSFDPMDPVSVDSSPATWLIHDLNQSIEDSRDQDLLIYVHGAKVNFYNACAFAAQLDHFLGRDMTSLAFSWPTRQNILSYVLGPDVKRAYASAQPLASLLEMLADHSDARRIHLVAWSAGSRVLTSAIAELKGRYPDLTDTELSERFRIGTLYFAASEIPRDEFVTQLPTLDSFARRIVVTASSNDSALRHASLFMGGGPRIGQLAGGITEEQLEIVFATEGLEVIDLSLGGEERGFDITGHRYWFNHPWASSDLILAIRSDLDPEDRNLEKTNTRVLWGIPPNYPERLSSMTEEDLKFREEDRP